MNSWSDSLKVLSSFQIIKILQRWVVIQKQDALITENQKQKHNICLQNKILNQLVLNVLCCELLAVNKTDRLIEKNDC